MKDGNDCYETALGGMPEQVRVAFERADQSIQGSLPSAAAHGIDAGMLETVQGRLRMCALITGTIGSEPTEQTMLEDYRRAQEYAQKTAGFYGEQPSSWLKNVSGVFGEIEAAIGGHLSKTTLDNPAP